MDSRWYALRSKPCKEEVLYRQVLSRGVEVYYPFVRVNPVNPRSRKVRPYFPGYMFVRTDIEETGLSVFQWMPFSTGLVCFGGEPAHVPESLLVELRRKLGNIKKQGGLHYDGLEPGKIVIITGGPFEGYQAIFDTRISGTERVRVLLKLLKDSRQVPLELHVGQMKPD